MSDVLSSNEAIADSGRPANVDLRSLDPGVSILDAFEFDTTDPSNPILKMRTGWSMQYIQKLVSGIAALESLTLLAPATTLAPNTTLFPKGDNLVL